MLDRRRWPHADAILDDALDRPREARAAFVRDAAGTDAALCDALLRVLAEADRADDFLAPGGALSGPLAGDLAAAAEASTTPRLEPGATFGAYRIERPLGAGGMGEVYRARDQRLDRAVALKVLPTALARDPGRHNRLEREARLLASLNHPNIGAIYGIAEHDGIVALVLELVEGLTLAERLKRGPLPIDEAIRLGIGIADALEAAHARGIVHRDLKPANIKVTSTGTVKVLDFGIATAVAAGGAGPDDGGEPLTVTHEHAPGLVFGTPAYVSPERARGHRGDHRADIWAFGCVLYEMLTAHRAFDGESAGDTLARVLEREPEFSRLPVRTPASLLRVLQRALQKDPAGRLGFIGDARLDLRDAASELAGTIEVGPMPRPHRRRAVAAAIAACVTGLAAGGAGIWWLLSPDPPRPTHLSVPVADEDDLVSGELPGLAISPDGRVVVYRTRREGRLVLARRSLDAGEPVVIDGSENGASPFFSPDGQWIGFASDAKLMRVPVAGGVPMAIADAPAGARASWCDDDVILFTTGTERVVFRVAASGGAASAVTRLGTEGGDLSHEGPVALPGCRAALLTVATPEGQRIGLADLATGAVRLVGEGRHPQYFRGFVTWVQSNAIWAARFDADAGVIGPASQLLDGVEQGTLNGTPHYAIGASGALVFLPRRPALDLKSLVWVERDGRETLLPVEPQPYTRASLSPDGLRIALAIASPENRDVWVYERARGTLMRLTIDPGVDTAPVWTPDGQQIAFRSERDGGGVFIAAADGASPARRLTRSDGPQRPAHTPYAFTPDGQTLLFAELRSYSDQGISAVTLGETPASAVVLDGPYAEARPALSPDGRWLAYQSDESGRYEIHVRPYPDVGARRLQVSSGGGSSARWSADGRELFYFDGAFMVAVPILDPATLTLGEARRLFEAAAFNERLGPVYDVSPDRRRFLFLREGAGGSQPGRRYDLRLIDHFDVLLHRLPAR